MKKLKFYLAALSITAFCCINYEHQAKFKAKKVLRKILKVLLPLFSVRRRRQVVCLFITLLETVADTWMKKQK